MNQGRVDDRTAAEPELGFEAFGVRGVLLVGMPQLRPRITALLPPGSVERPQALEDPRFSLRAADGAYRVEAGGSAVASTADIEVALAVLGAEIRAHVALNAPEHIFVRAAVVEVNDRAVVIPGQSFSGKTTLAAALLALGARHYSDEFAVLDRDGLVHPYPSPALTAAAGTAPIPIGLIAITQYTPHGAWRPQQRTAGEGGLALVVNAMAAEARPEQAVATIAKATADALTLEGKRGEAARAAPTIMAAAASGSQSSYATAKLP